MLYVVSQETNIGSKNVHNQQIVTWYERVDLIEQQLWETEEVFIEVIVTGRFLLSSGERPPMPLPKCGLLTLQI